jgi:DNA-binding IclR family transcriptional regulator
MQSTDETVGEADLSSEGPAPRAKPLAPAVARAVRIIGYLGETEEGASVSDIARALSINKSTCFNILSTLVDNQVVSKHPRFHIYRLGPRLVEWGRASRTQFAVRTGLRDAIGEFVTEVGAACLVGQTLADNRGVVVFDRMVPNRPDVLVPQIGEVFPLSDPAMGRLVFSSFEDEEDALRVARQVGLIGPNADAAEFTNDLARIRQQGYSASRGGDINAVATALSPSASEIMTLLCVIGHERDLPDEKVDGVGVRLIEFGHRLLSRPATSEAFMAWSVGGSSGA